jgi:hypothetical protein
VWFLASSRHIYGAAHDIAPNVTLGRIWRTGSADQLAEFIVAVVHQPEQVSPLLVSRPLGVRDQQLRVRVSGNRLAIGQLAGTGALETTAIVNMLERDRPGPVAFEAGEASHLSSSQVR